MKNVIAPMDITIIEGNRSVNYIHVFEGSFDYLSYLKITQRQLPDGGTIILNSTSTTKKAIEYISSHWTYQNASYNIILWLDNELDGSNAQANIENVLAQFDQLNIPVFMANENYIGYQDLNAYWTNDGKVCEPNALMVAPYNDKKLS